jgi:hypothetical protein
MTDKVKRLRESAERIIRQEGRCDNISCTNCPLSRWNNEGDENCTTSGRKPSYINERDSTAVANARKYLEETMEEKEIIGWPGNAEEMRQYIGRKCIVSDYYENLFNNEGVEGTFDEVVKKPYPKYRQRFSGAEFDFIRVLPEPVVTEITADAAIAELARARGVDPSTIRIKGGA